MKRNIRMLSILLVVMLMLCTLAGCSGGSVSSESLNSAGARDEFYDGIYDSVSEAVDSKTELGSAGVQNQKLIRTMNLDAETDDLDGLLAALDAKIAALGGYVENKNLRNGGTYSGRSYRYADMTIRIPVEQLDSFVEHIQGETNVVSYQESADDVTLSYVATQSRITALETEQARLLELLAQAENMSDLLMIEQRLTEVRTELEEVTSRLRLYDNLVDYGTVNLSVTEVQEFTVVEEETLWQRISSGFMNSVRDLWKGVTEVFVFLVVSAPYWLVFGLIAAVIVVAVRRRLRKRKPQEPQPPQPSAE